LQIIVFEDSVLIFDDDEGLHKHISVWEIPPLQPAQAISKTRPRTRDLLHVYSNTQYCVPCPQLAWFRSYPDHPCHFDFLGMASNGQNGISRYKIKRIRANDPDLPSIFPCQSFQYLPHSSYPAINWVREFNSTRLWDGSVLLLWIEDHTLIANLSESSDILGMPDADRQWFINGSVSAILHDAIDRPMKGAVAHCPISGRLCVRRSNEIHVLDYLVPPVTLVCLTLLALLLPQLMLDMKLSER
jgi:hypothetical protein